MRKNKGFTLIEIIVSVAILVILAGGVFPVFNYISGSSAQNKVKHEAEQIAQSKMETVKGMLFKDIGIVTSYPKGLLEESELVETNGRKYSVQYDITYDDNHDEVPYKTIGIRVSTQDVNKQSEIKVYAEAVAIITEKGEFVIPEPTPDPNGRGTLNLVLINLIKNENGHYQQVNEHTVINPLTVRIRRNGALVREFTTSVYQYDNLINGTVIKVSGISSTLVGQLVSSVGYTISIKGELTNHSESSVISAFKFNESTNLNEIISMYNLRQLPRWNGRIDVDESVNIICPVYTNGLYHDVYEDIGFDNNTVVDEGTIELKKYSYEVPTTFNKESTYSPDTIPGRKGIYNIFKEGNTWNVAQDSYEDYLLLWNDALIVPQELIFEFLKINSSPVEIKVYGLSNYYGSVPSEIDDGQELIDAFNLRGELLAEATITDMMKSSEQILFNTIKGYKYFKVKFTADVIGDDHKGICQVKTMNFNYYPYYYNPGNHISGPYLMYDYPKDVPLQILWDELGSGIDGSSVNAWYGFSFDANTPPQDTNGWIPITNGYTFNPGFIPSNTYVWIKHAITPSIRDGTGYQTPQISNLRIDYVVPEGL